jgi:hypothetical protein
VKRVVSSQVNQLFQGVTPPAQLRMVPLRLSRAPMKAPALPSNSNVVVPPPAPGS